MKTYWLALVTVIVVLAAQAEVLAQAPAAVAGVQPLYTTQPYYSARPRYVAPVPHYWRYHASTAAEGYMRGMAAVIAARGYYNRMTAEAWATAEEARSRHIANRQQATATFFAMRAANREARKAERGPRPTAEQLARLAKQAAPDRPEADEVNRANGQIHWPALLQGAEFAALRAELDYVFALRAANGGVGAREEARVQRATQAMLAQLSKHVHDPDVTPMDYTLARQFIESLAYEVQLPVS